MGSRCHLTKTLRPCSKAISKLNEDFAQPTERHLKLLERLSTAVMSNGKRQELNFCRLSSAVCTVELKYLYLR